MMAGGLHGIEKELELEPPLEGNAYDSDAPKVPHTMVEAREAFTTSVIARAALGDEVVDHYTNMADIELRDYDATVTDWELRRGFERM
jgi:glutamine synthetase